MKTSTKILFVLCDYRHILPIVLILLGSWYSKDINYSAFKAAYHLNQGHEETWGFLDHKRYTGDTYHTAYEFSFVVQGEGEFKVTSYFKFNKFSEGDSLLIQYVPEAPHYARIINMDTTEDGGFSLYWSLSLVFTGLLISGYALFTRLRNLRIATTNSLKKVKFIDDRPLEWFLLSSQHEDRQSLYFCVFRFQVKGEKAMRSINAFKFHWSLTDPDQYALISPKSRMFLLNHLPVFLTKMVIKELQRKEAQK